MAEPVLSVCWKDHTSELATVYKSLLENNFLVDCTLSAEGRSLKAHRLVLSACSPYFHMLFCEETGKHPFVILLDASFETLKAVIDFVYRGEAQIPEGNLKPFLTLAQSLQIKGLNAFTQDDKIKRVSRNTAGNDPYGPSENNEDICEVRSNSASQKDIPEKSSQQFPDYSDLDNVHTNSSVPFEAFHSLSEEVQSEPVVTPQTPVGHNEVPEDAEITVKDEPLFPAFSETVNKRLDNTKRNVTLSEDFLSEMDGGASFIFGDQDLNQHSSGGSSHGNVESSVITHSQHHFTQSNEVASGRDVAEKCQPLQPVILVPKSEQMDDAESEENVDDYNVPGSDMNETYEETEDHGGEEKLAHCPRAEGRPPGNDLATPQRSGVRLWGPGTQEQSTTPLAHSALRLPEGQDEEPGPSATDREALSSSSSLAAHKPTRKRKHSCYVCGASFIHRSHLNDHTRTHTGERPYHCDVCGKRFLESSTFNRHCRTHTGERPYHCDVCGKRFREAGALSKHNRVHTGERPFSCDVCGASFTQHGGLANHRRKHTGERPFSCDVCGVSFFQRCTLVDHIRRHTGERPFSCDVCGASFTRRSRLITHSRIHTGERPYHCDVCGKKFVESGSLAKHYRTHTGERPFSCKVCGASFSQRTHLNKHSRTHTGDPP